MKLFEDNSTFTLRRTYTLSPTDREVLLRLYQPLIGGEALAVYLLFDSLLPTFGSRSGWIKELLVQAGITGSHFLLARERLEAVRLLSTYSREKGEVEEFLFDIHQPLDPQTFFSHSLFFPLLKSRLDSDKSITALKEYFCLNYAVASDFSERTAPFDQVFEINDIFFSQEEQQETSQLLAGRSQLSFDSFDEKSFEESVMAVEPLLSIADISAKDLSDIKAISMLYALPAEQAAKFYLDSSSTRGVFNIEKFTSLARSYVKNDFERDQYVQEEVNLFVGDSIDAKKMKLVVSMSPAKLIYALTRVNPFEEDYRLIERLNREYGLSPRIINVIIDATFQFCHGKLVAKYAEKIAASLLYNQIAEPYEAFTFIYQEHHRFGQSRSKKQLEQGVLDTNLEQLKAGETNLKSSDSLDEGELLRYLKENVR